MASAVSNRRHFAPRPHWHDLYRAAITELDRAKLPGLLAEARHAIWERVEEISTNPAVEEQYDLKRALRSLSLLEAVTEREKLAS
jgi:hypothetical protein